jgi:hypothetical protein
MKRYYKIIVAVFLFASLAGCKKSFLDIIPKGSQVAVSTNDYDLLMNNNSLYFYQASGGLREFVLMGDEIAAEAGFFGKQQNDAAVLAPRAFQWADRIFESKNYPLDLQSQTGEMYLLNKVINEVMGSAEGSDEQKKSLQAEAKAERAFLNFSLVNIYGKPYLASTAGSDPAFPLIMEASTSATNFKRASVQECYDLIIKDLMEAMPSLPVENMVHTRMSRAAAEALLAKVYMFMGKFSDALPLLNSAFSDVASFQMPVRLYDYNVEFAPGGSFLPISSYSGPNGPGNNYTDLTESVLDKTFMGGPFDGNGFENDGLVLTPAAAALYAPSDLRLLQYTDMNADGTPNAGGRLRKYGLLYIRFGIELSEMYLLRAECKARTSDLTGAIADVETLRKNRMPPADAAVPGVIAADQTALIKFIIDERIREFAFTGFRWFDMRRLSVDPLFTGAVYTHTLYDPSGNTVYTLKQPERFVLQIPDSYINANPGMVNNP